MERGCELPFVGAIQHSVCETHEELEHVVELALSGIVGKSICSERIRGSRDKHGRRGALR
jgi:hypothetical protein